MREMCNAIKETNQIHEIDLTHLKEANKIDWKDYLDSLSLLSAQKKDYCLKIKLSEYQTRTKQKLILDYMTDNKPNIEINYC